MIKDKVLELVNQKQTELASQINADVLQHFTDLINQIVALDEIGDAEVQAKLDQALLDLAAANEAKAVVENEKVVLQAKIDQIKALLG